MAKQYFHKAYGEVFVTQQCLTVQRQMATRGFSKDSMLVELKGSLLEVSKDMVREVVS